MDKQLKNQVWIFGAWIGERYADNSKYLFEYASSFQNIETVWLTKNQRVYERLKAENRNVEYFYSWRSIQYCLRATHIIVSVAYNDVSPLAYLLSPNAKIINLWHGTPLKKLDFKRGYLNRMSRWLFLSYIGRQVDYVTSASPAVSTILKSYFHVKDDCFLLTGYPRNDGLIKGLGVEKSNFKKILFMPTFRDHSSDVNLFEEFGFSFDEMEKFLKENRAIFYIKMHPKDVIRNTRLFSTMKNTNFIRVLTDLDINDDIYPFLGTVDILITDYSSVYLDYLLLNRPIIFSCFDKELYISKDRGFYFDYDKVTPGRKAKNWTDVLDELKTILVMDTDRFRKERETVNSLLNSYCDDRNSERVFKKIISGV